MHSWLLLCHSALKARKHTWSLMQRIGTLEMEHNKNILHYLTLCVHFENRKKWIQRLLLGQYLDVWG